MKLCAVDIAGRDKPEDMPFLNHYTNSTLDFSKVFWEASYINGGCVVRACYSNEDIIIEGHDIIQMSVWPYLTDATRRVVLQAAILTAAANMVAAYREGAPNV